MYRKPSTNPNIARDENPTFFSMDLNPAQLEINPDPAPDLTLNRNEEKNIFIF